ncbi:MAG: META domain-containing protein [Candidatus Nanopelagicales bacterium]
MTTDLLTGRTFAVRAVAGAVALAEPTAELSFADGRVSGRATVNRVTGSYELDEATLVCGPLMTTLMAGPPEAMEQERALLDVLAARPTVRAADDGSVELVTDAGVTALHEVEEVQAL